ncbi:pentatricopeptide repeat-containing protein At4g21065-like [Phalaenopsis equestris]|uniref:pentatricopeptide repeat-containing protein At4g21065-like n=1 Tax=Phalaenopsis equestris TaxID=78828 RepID=UPI0009E3466C|nr:pentatricopeptide repeat-containing protein At4g21065-like [Phalaenopsis equestris]
MIALKNLNPRNLLRKISPFSLLSVAIHHYSSLEATSTREEEHGKFAFPSFHLREQTLVSLFHPCSTMRELSQIHALIIRSGFAQHVFVVGRLISFCAVSEFGSMKHANDVFEDINFPDAFICNTMIRGFVRTGSEVEAIDCFKRMRRDGKQADNFTFSFLLKLCGQLFMVELGKQVHCSLLKDGYEVHTFVRNTLIHMYGMFRNLAAARHLFDEMPVKDLVSWNALIDGLVHCMQYKEALRMFVRMQESGIAPDAATFVVVLSSCAEFGELGFGQRVHSKISTCVLDEFISVSNSLIDMYSKCGAIDLAVLVFQRMKERNTVSWNSMILGLAMHGRAREALQLFEELQLTEFGEPNGITFLGVLCACSHGGLLEEGRRYFHCMRRDYGIDPSVQHYGCMVDLLGRTGLLGEAYEVIRSMPTGGNAVMWRTLLGACRVHGDLEMGESVRKHLIELEPDHSSDFVLLSHMYAMVGRWNDVLNVREDMLGVGVQKPQPGNSFIDSFPCGEIPATAFGIP